MIEALLPDTTFQEDPLSYKDPFYYMISRRRAKVQYIYIYIYIYIQFNSKPHTLLVSSAKPYAHCTTRKKEVLALRRTNKLGKEWHFGGHPRVPMVSRTRPCSTLVDDHQTCAVRRSRTRSTQYPTSLCLSFIVHYKFTYRSR